MKRCFLAQGGKMPDAIPADGADITQPNAKL
jgi:hypothetical protein